MPKRATPHLTIDLRMYRHSGIGRYLRNLIPLVLPLVEARAVTILGTSEVLGKAPWLEDPRITLAETSAPIYSVAEQMLRFRKPYRNTDLLWVPHYNAPLWYRRPMVVTVHDIAPLAMPKILDSRLKRRYARLLIERATAHAAAILCVSEFTAQELISRLGVSREKITVAHQGVDPAWPDQTEPHRELDGTPFLLYVGNVKPNKNLSLLLAAFKQVEYVLPYRLVLVGKKTGFRTEDQAVLRQAETMGDRVRFTGEISDKALTRLYAGAQALVLPSLYEGFGLPLLEAMQMGCPVLSSSAASLPEIAGDAALFFDPHSIDSLVNSLLRVPDRPFMTALAAAGRIRVRDFSYQHCAMQTASVLNRLLRT